MSGLIIPISFASAIVLVSIATGLWFARKTRKKVEYMLDALEDNETNFKFSEEMGIDRKLNCTLNRMKVIFEKERDRIKAQEVFYGKMLDDVSTGILVADDSGNVVYANRSALDMLGLLTLMNIRQLAGISQELADAFGKVVEGHGEKATFINNMTRMTISLEATFADFGDRRVKIISINNISEEVEKSEATAWNKLIRVLTHEIMNTVTPISSLSEALAGFTDRNTAPELKEGLETISQSSKSLIKFVESYRNMTRVPVPVKKVLYLKDILDRAMHLLESGLAESGATCTCTLQQPDIIVYADMDQILQIIINIIRNAMQAGATLIRISARVDTAESVIIDIGNNGMPISPESRDEIFVPFYTTKPSGSGIGLSLSRQIMRLHNGNLILSGSNENETVFTLIFK